MPNCLRCKRDRPRLATKEACDACYRRERRGSKASGPIREPQNRGGYHSQEERDLRKAIKSQPVILTPEQAALNLIRAILEP